MFQNGPRGPAVHPRPAAPPRPAPPPSVPIRQLVNPVTPYRAPAASQAHLAHLSGRTSPVAAFQAQGRSTANTSRSPAAATTQRLAKAIGAPRQSMAALERSVFNRMAQAGVLAPGAKLPKLIVDKADPSWMASYGKGALAEYVTPGTGPGGRVVHIPPSTAKNQAARPWVQQSLVHEIAHTMQNKDALSTESLREGGAQAFTENVAPRVLPNQQRYGPGGYSDYVNQMFAREPFNWIRQGQFQPGRTAPKVNMPGTPSFRVAMGGVGRRAGDAVQFAGVKPEMQGALKRRRTP